VISLSHVTYTYPAAEAPALRDVSVEIPAGQFCGVVGPNRAGKSTLAYVLAGFAPHFYRGKLQGRAMVAGQDTAATPLRELVVTTGLVFQNPFNQITGARYNVREEIAFGLENLGVPRAEMRERVEAAMALMGIEALAERSPLALSGGQMQRVALASIVVMRPRVLILDEPTSQLDPIGSREVFAAVRALAAQGGMTVVMIEHKLEWVAEFAERVIALVDGQIAADGAPAQVLTDAALAARGVGQTRYTLAARAARRPGSGWLPVTLDEAVGWFGATLRNS
jgi:energy-coupling factor transporter ATP-binding protein EcfA2